MTRKDYLLLAAAMMRTRPFVIEVLRFRQWNTDCHALANTLAEQSRGFNRDQFLANCQADRAPAEVFDAQRCR